MCAIRLNELRSVVNNTLLVQGFDLILSKNLIVIQELRQSECLKNQLPDLTPCSTFFKWRDWCLAPCLSLSVYSHGRAVVVLTEFLFVWQKRRCTLMQDQIYKLKTICQGHTRLGVDSKFTPLGQADWPFSCLAFPLKPIHCIFLLSDFYPSNRLHLASVYLFHICHAVFLLSDIFDSFRSLWLCSVSTSSPTMKTD